jgi:hypothetical protein
VSDLGSSSGLCNNHVMLSEAGGSCDYIILRGVLSFTQ